MRYSSGDLFAENVSDLLKLSAKPYTPPREGMTYSAGDTHGNAVVLAKYLFEAGMINLTESEYQELLAIYKNESPTRISCLTRAECDRFREIIRNGFARTNVPDHIKLRCFGDTLADRGANDILTLIILDEMHRRFPKLERIMLLSNHDKSFISNFLLGKLLPGASLSTELSPCDSLIRFKSLLENGVITMAELFDMVSRAYLPGLRLIDYKRTEDGSGIDIMTHAPFTLDALENAMKNLLPISEQRAIYESVENVTRVIDGLNNLFDSSLQNPSSSIYKAITSPPSPNNLLQTFIWPRLRDIEALGPSRPAAYAVRFRHGHDGEPGEKVIHGIPYLGYNSVLGKATPEQWQRVDRSMYTMSSRSFEEVDSAIREILNAETDQTIMTNVASEIRVSSREIPEPSKQALMNLKLFAIARIEQYIGKRGSYTHTSVGDKLWTGMAQIYNATIGNFFSSVDVPHVSEATALKNIILSLSFDNLDSSLPSIAEHINKAKGLEASNAYKKMLDELSLGVTQLGHGTPLERLGLTPGR